MKRIILVAMVAAFAVAVQAGDAKNCQVKDKPACCPSKAQASEQAKEGTCCPYAKAACCKKKQAPAKQSALASPKAAESAK